MAMINSPFQVLFEGMECRRNIIHLPVLSEKMKSSFIHLIESRCSMVAYDRTTNLSICMSAEDTSHGARDNLANNGVRWGKTYWAKQSKRFSCQLHERRKQYRTQKTNAVVVIPRMNQILTLLKWHNTWAIMLLCSMTKCCHPYFTPMNYAWHDNSNHHYISICCMYYQLFKATMVRMGSMKQKPRVSFFLGESKGRRTRHGWSR